MFNFDANFRNIDRPSERIFDRQKGPLIGCVLWTDDEPNQVNHNIKNILKLFVDYISVDFPADETHVLAVSSDLQIKSFPIFADRLVTCALLHLHFLLAIGEFDLQCF